MKKFMCFGGRFRIKYWYFDTEEYLADAIFVKNKITVYFGDEWHKEDEPYCVIECKIKRRDKERFEKSFEEISNKMLLMGHTDYDKYCENMINQLEEKEDGISD